MQVSRAIGTFKGRDISIFGNDVISKADAEFVAQRTFPELPMLIPFHKLDKFMDTIDDEKCVGELHYFLQWCITGLDREKLEINN